MVEAPQMSEKIQHLVMFSGGVGSWAAAKRVAAGQAHFLHLLKVFPERYAYHEAKEQEIREYLDADVSILRDRRGGLSRPMTLRDLRKRHESGDEQLDFLEWGGCGCAF